MHHRPPRRRFLLAASHSSPRPEQAMPCASRGPADAWPALRPCGPRADQGRDRQGAVRGLTAVPRSLTVAARMALSGAILLAAASICFAAPPLTHGHYRVLTADPEAPAPFAAVDFAYGPAGAEAGVAWQVSVFKENQPGQTPLMEWRAVTSRDPLADSADPLEFFSHQLRIPETGEAYAYVNVHTGRPLLPAWGDFVQYFVPRPARATRRQEDMPNTCEYLGHVLTLYHTGRGAAWPEWEGVKTLKLDPELLIGTGRPSKDREGHRLPQQPERQNYDYVPFTAEDYRVMIDAGVNLFTVTPQQETHVRGEPAFYARGAGGKPALRYPADLYRANYIGATLFMDEPTILMIGDKSIHTTLRYFTDAADLITRRVHARYHQDGSYGMYQLERQLRNHGIGMGFMRIAQVDYPSWETVYETAFYQLAGGLAGIVHEGRYQLGEFNDYARASTGIDRTYTAEEMFRYIYAQLRGAARHFGKNWGTSIYGQADPELSPLAMSMAYDRGARYLWYWTSDHEHHLPWPEQLELTRALRRHAADHPRGSIRAELPILDKVILIPYGYFLTLESSTNRRHGGDLWWVRELDPEKQNESSRRYRRLVTRVFTEVNKALDAGEEFDITIDDGRAVRGYRQIVRATDEE